MSLERWTAMILISPHSRVWEGDPTSALPLHTTEWSAVDATQIARIISLTLPSATSVRLVIPRPQEHVLDLETERVRDAESERQRGIELLGGCDPGRLGGGRRDAADA